jgi:hypothetical protein
MMMILGLSDRACDAEDEQATSELFRVNVKNKTKMPSRDLDVLMNSPSTYYLDFTIHKTQAINRAAIWIYGIIVTTCNIRKYKALRVFNPKAFCLLKPEYH